MPDPEMIATGGLAYLYSKDALEKLLGPTAEYIGERGRDLVRKADENLSRIVHSAMQRLGSRIDEPGQVSPRVLRHVWEEGRYCEDELAAEYFGGLLASSRTEDGDDRAVSYLRLLEELSTSQIKLHYLVYSLIRRHFLGQNLSIQVAQEHTMELFIPEGDFDCLGIPEDLLDSTMVHAVSGLHRHDLIGDRFVYADVNTMRVKFPKATSGGLIIRPSKFGVELFLWAHGHPNALLDRILDPEIPINDFGFDIPNNSIPTH